MLGGDSDRVAVIAGDGSLTYAELDEQSARLAAGLRQAGLEPGDRFAFLMPNCPELVLSVLACLRGGVVALPLNTRYRAPEVDYSLARSGAALLAVHPDLQAAAANAPRTVTTDSDEWRELLDTPPAPTEQPGPEAPAIILFTSGSTAAPKGVTHTQASVAHTARVQAEFQRLGPDDVNLVTLAACHIAGLFGQILNTLRAGGTCLLHPRFDASAAAKAIAQHKVTRIQLLPAQLSDLLDAAEEGGDDLSGLHVAIAGGDSVPLEVHQRFESITGVKITEVCGMTECFNWSMNPPFGTPRPGSIGQPPPGTELRLGEHDEVLVRSGGTMAGYWDDPENTAAAFTGDGWLRTGDVARRDDDGWWWFVGRRKQIIVRGGSNIAPGEVEAVLLQHPAVHEAIVVGVPDDHLGQRVAAWVTPESVPIEDLKEFAAERIAAYKVPEWIWAAGGLPTTSVGKYDRTALARDAAERAAAAQTSQA